jgi:hypothetical protein
VRVRDIELEVGGGTQQERLPMSGVAKLHQLWFDTEIARQNHPQRSPADCKSALQFRKAKALGTKNFLFGEGSAKAAKWGPHVQIYAPQVPAHLRPPWCWFASTTS